MTALRDAVVQGDAPAKTAAHSLKGSSSTMGARMATLCDELEALAQRELGGAPLVVALDDEFVRVEAALHLEQQSSA
jgi:HPt (histidine-containing phosphotransfer) domain-containing protein